MATARAQSVDFGGCHCECNNNNVSQVDEAVGEALARQVEKMVEELHQEEAELVREPPEGQEVRSNQ